MRESSPFAVIWRRKGIILATVLVFVAATAALSASLQKVYSTSSTLLIALP
ncbi:MAG: hypothetical protein H0V29_07910 [Thermoleophilaceae bacterium]|nr:hypothetical protein [Thermoleophilaceae bacterium]